jgi:hypothetical protein
MVLLFLVLGIALLLGLAMARSSIQIAFLRRKGVYPQPGKATMAYVRRLVQSRKSVLAIRCYREIHPKVSLRDARKAIDKIALSESSN